MPNRNGKESPDFPADNALTPHVSSEPLFGDSMNNCSKKSLSSPRRQLLEMMQKYSFCRIENLEILGGEPVLDPPPRVIQNIKIGGQNGPQPELSQDDFVLKAPVAELFEHLTRLGDGRVALIEVRHGLPCRMIVEHAPSEGAE